jgi:primosomal protein N' (replication factor Y)
LPEHYVIRAASRHDYKSFYHRELDYRQRLGYPPFTQLVRLEYRSRDMEQVEQATQEMAANIRRRMAREDRRATQMIGPAPCFFSRMGGEYRWQIVLRGPDPASLFRRRPLGEWRIEVNPPNLL